METKKKRGGLKIVLIVAVILVVLIAFGATADDDEKKEDTKKEPTKTEETKKEDKKDEPVTGKVDKISLDNSEGTLVYTKHEMTTDFEGKPAIRIYFDYTNKKDKTSIAQYTFSPKVFQNGVECDMGISMETNEGQSNAIKELQKDTTLNVAYIFVLQDSTSPVTLKVEDISSDHLLSNVSQEQDIALQ